MDERVALVTGGAKGIGRAVVGAFVAAGARVMVVGRDVGALDAVRDELAPHVACFAADITDPDAATGAVRATLDTFDRLDVLVNNAAVFLDRGPLIELDDTAFETTWRTNVQAPLRWSRAAWRAWMGRAGGSIINISSNTASQATFGGAYVLTKVALDHLTRQLAVELAPNVRVNAIAPGLIQTDISSGVFAEPGLPRIPPLGRHGLVEDCVGAALYLATGAASWVTGQVLVVDGGASIYDFERGPKLQRPE